MNKQVSAALTEIGQLFGDTRTQLCQIEAASMDGERCVLSGAVLDSETLAAVVTELACPSAGRDLRCVIGRGAAPAGRASLGRGDQSDRPLRQAVIPCGDAQSSC